MTQFRRLDNGYLIAPKRGTPPVPPDGYEAAYGDPFVFLPSMPECADREKRVIKRSCCDPIQRLFCKLEQQFVTRLHCQGCDNHE